MTPQRPRRPSTVENIVNAASDIAEFLATRRARITPQQAGLPSYGQRRVAGLRREEVASLAGVSADYYRRLERGQVSGVSELVLEALSRALQLDEAEHAHLFDLARAASPVAAKRAAAGPQAHPTGRAAHARPARRRRRSSATATATTWVPTRSAAPSTRRCSRVANSPPTARASPSSTPPPPDFFPEWERLATDLVATLRSQAGRNPYDRSLQDLIGELSTRSDAFRVRWAAHNVRFHRTGTKRLQHPVVGELELDYETLTLDADDGLRVAVYTAPPGSAAQHALDLLASWTATPDPERTARP